MTVRVHIPPVLRSIAGGKRTLDAQGATIGAVLQCLVRDNPSLAWHLFDENGVVRRHVLCVHGGEAVRPIDFATRAIGDGDEIVLANALAGG